MQTDDKAALALSEDWGIKLDGKQVNRWAFKFGLRLQEERDTETRLFECGVPFPAPANAAQLLVLGPDGGRVQMRDADPESGSRWREDKVFTVTSYLPGDGQELPPKPVQTTYVATMEKVEDFKRLARVEAERRGAPHAAQVLVIADCGNWIDPLQKEEFPGATRIADWPHAKAHLYACGRAAQPTDQAAAKRVSEAWVKLLWDGKVRDVSHKLKAVSARAGAPAATDGPDHPRRVLAQNMHYFTHNEDHMHYPEYRAKGWPIGSGNTEAGVKLFNKRVKGTEQFWSQEGAEAILCLRALWLSQDGRWERYWASRPAYRRAPA
jgi:hypothetical protein